MTSDAIEQLERHLGIASEFEDYKNDRVLIPRQARDKLMLCLGFDPTPEGATHALEALENDAWAQVLPPVWIGREGDTVSVAFNLSAALEAGPVAWRVHLEQDQTLEQPIDLNALKVTDKYAVEDVHYARRTMQLDIALPVGSHLLELVEQTSAAVIASMPLIIAPQKFYEPEPLRSGGKLFGTSMQLYTLRSDRNWGMGDFTDLNNFIISAAPQGIDIVGLNPLHALFPANPLHISPYSPSNRAFINVMYIDPEAVAEFAECGAAQKKVSDAEFQRKLADLRATKYVDYAGVARHKLVVLALLYDWFKRHHLPHNTDRALAYRQFVAEEGEPLRVHATYDALHEHFLRQDMNLWGWPVWPVEYRNPSGDAVARFVAEHEARVEYYQYLQWRAFEQLREAQKTAVDAGMAVGIYLDLAVGADQSGSEAWSNQRLYCLNASVGAPPDLLGREGQDWGFPPFDPAALRADAYATFAHNIRASMSCAGAVRFDHCVALLRLWWIPRGEGPKAGAYIHYGLQDIMGVLALESWRNECLVIGDDLGTVPKALTQVMHDNHLYAYRVLYFARAGDQLTAPQDYPARATATVTTHDLATLASWWDLSDLDLRVKLKVFVGQDVIDELRSARAEEKQLLLDALHQYGFLPEAVSVADVPLMTPSLCAAVHLYLASTAAGVMISQLEDWLGMLEPVNVPGTHNEYPNWQRKLSAPIEQIFERSDVVSLCKELTQRRAVQQPLFNSSK